MAVTTPAPASMEVLTMRVCSIEGCGERHRARGYCQGHYGRWHYHGDPLAGRPGRGESLRWLDVKLADLHANPSEDCVVSPFWKDAYTRVNINGRNMSVAHLVLELTVGPAPAGLVACHQPIVCHNRSCINPAHLRWDTPRNNALDMLLDNTQWTRKLSERDAWEIPQLYATGEWTHRQLAAEFQVTHGTIGDVIRGTIWRHIEGVPRPSERDHPPRFT